MFKLLLVVLPAIQLHLMTALFTVEVLQSQYSVEYQSNVTLRCCFPVNSQLDFKMLSILWKRTSPRQEEKEIYKLHKGQEDLTLQDPDYRGRATLLHEELQMGCSALSITKVKVTDAGSFLCVINYGEADYKYITLEVKAPYKRINIQKIKDPKEEGLILICQSEGYPLAEVSWHDGRNPNVSMFANTTFELTEEGLFNVTSILQVKQSISGNYTCVFWNKKLNEKTYRSAFQLDYVDESASGYQHFYLVSFISASLVVLSFLLLFVFKVVRRTSSTNLYIQKGNCRKVSHGSRVKEADASLEITSSSLI
ncbi:programmed cell death 1 ligand 1-like [Sphaerodactylus townsendi]|uniref:programmed cell death 1 ligand 1-like n=1 Tax=Sphaerodactylus townsendi TaxID=933632 RepID=UPI002025C6D0|nr:programmed cell death 1 ligand 1-like [Sphaerodactylus townsendi]XP_048360765.1 programmed cell death 1 ligand 1-like [Sphaerodactylus townsendi]XP_048360766.1 programmed cell death 1 ligand 1-like [Sphaerodactylus townsendi]